MISSHTSVTTVTFKTFGPQETAVIWVNAVEQFFSDP